MPNPRTKLTFIRRLCKDKSHKKTLTSASKSTKQNPRAKRSDFFQHWLVVFCPGFSGGLYLKIWGSMTVCAKNAGLRCVTRTYDCHQTCHLATLSDNRFGNELWIIAKWAPRKVRASIHIWAKYCDLHKNKLIYLASKSFFLYLPSQDSPSHRNGRGTAWNSRAMHFARPDSSKLLLFTSLCLY